MAEINLFNADIKFTYEYSKDTISFVDLKVISSNGKSITSLYSKPTHYHQYLHYGSYILNIVKALYCIAKLWELKKGVLTKWTVMNILWF